MGQKFVGRGLRGEKRKTFFEYKWDRGIGVGFGFASEHDKIPDAVQPRPT